MADPECAAADRVDRGAVGRAVVGEDPLDVDAVAGVERPGAFEKGDRGGGFLVGQHFGVRQASAVIDRDMHAFPADRPFALAGEVRAGRVPAALAGDAMPGAALDPPKLLHIDMDQLAGPGALVALGRLKTEPAELAHP